MRRLFILLFMLLSGLAQAGNNPFEVKPDFLPVGKAFVFTSERLASGKPSCSGKSPMVITCISSG